MRRKTIITPQGAVVRVDQITAIIPIENKHEAATIRFGDQWVVAEWDDSEERCFQVDQIRTTMDDVDGVCPTVEMTEINRSFRNIADEITRLCDHWTAPKWGRIIKAMADGIKAGR